jgi:hypothetical protein
VLRRRGLAPRFVPPISLILATHADAYIRGLTNYRYAGDPGDAATAGVLDWVELFIADTARACRDAAGFADRLEKLEIRWRDQAGKVRHNSATDVLLANLAGAPVLTVATATQMLGRSVTKTNDAINVLVNAGVLHQTTVGRRNRAFEVPDLLDEVTAFERQLASPVGDTHQAAPTRPVPAKRSPTSLV